MIVLCKVCRGTSEGIPAEVLTVGYSGPCDVCGMPDRGNNRSYRTDPRDPLEVLLKEVDDICDWLDYYPPLNMLEDSLRKLNGARLRYHVAKIKERAGPKAVPTTPPE